MIPRAFRSLNRAPAFAAGALLASLLLSGCSVIDAAGLTPPAEQPRHVPANHLGLIQMPAEVRRVVLLPVAAGLLVTPETAAEFDQIFTSALQRRMRFEVVPVSRAWCRRYFGAPEFSSVAALPHNFLDRLATEHAADAVLFVDITSYRDFRPLAIGVRAKLALFAGPRVIWTYDEVLSTATPAVANSAQDHIRATGTGGLPVDLSASALQSPSRFAAYVADTTFGTLPPR